MCSAVVVAFGISYDEAFRILDAGPDGCVWDFPSKIGNMVINGWQMRSVKEMTASGRYICTKRGGRHVVAYIDGVRHDSVSGQSPISKTWALVRPPNHPVVTKPRDSAAFGNGTLGFIRVRQA